MDNENKTARQWNITQLAEAFNSTRPTVRKRLREAGVLPVGRIGNAPVYLMCDAAKAMYERKELGKGKYGGYESPDKMPPKARRDWFDSERARMAVEKESKRLIPAQDVRKGYGYFVRAVEPPLNGLVRQLKACGLEQKVLTLAQAQVDSIQEQMYLAATKAGADLDDSPQGGAESLQLMRS